MKLLRNPERSRMEKIRTNLQESRLPSNFKPPLIKTDFEDARKAVFKGRDDIYVCPI